MFVFQLVDLVRQEADCGRDIPAVGKGGGGQTFVSHRFADATQEGPEHGHALRRTNYLYPGYSFNLPSYHAQFGAQTGGSSKDKG